MNKFFNLSAPLNKLGLCFFLIIFMSGLWSLGACRTEKTMGANYFQAKTNCELILKGEARDCTYGGNIWYCSCDIDCSQNELSNSNQNNDNQYNDYAGRCREERTMGADYFQAKTNCELILKGRASHCTYGGNIWYCTCRINCR